jgi:hypothetical protein
MTAKFGKDFEIMAIEKELGYGTETKDIYNPIEVEEF